MVVVEQMKVTPDPGAAGDFYGGAHGSLHTPAAGSTPAAGPHDSHENRRQAAALLQIDLGNSFRSGGDNVTKYDAENLSPGEKKGVALRKPKDVSEKCALKCIANGKCLAYAASNSNFFEDTEDNCFLLSSHWGSGTEGGTDQSKKPQGRGFAWCDVTDWVFDDNAAPKPPNCMTKSYDTSSQKFGIKVDGTDVKVNLDYVAGSPCGVTTWKGMVNQVRRMERRFLDKKEMAAFLNTVKDDFAKTPPLKCDRSECWAMFTNQVLSPTAKSDIDPAAMSAAGGKSRYEFAQIGKALPIVDSKTNKTQNAIPFGTKYSAWQGGPHAKSNDKWPRWADDLSKRPAEPFTIATPLLTIDVATVTTTTTIPSWFNIPESVTRYKCWANECTCNNGEEPARGADCHLHGAEKCMKCHPGYFLTLDNRCQPYQCQCPNGKPNRTPGACTRSIRRHCISCDLGFYLVPSLKKQKRCGIKECACPNGLAAKGQQCHTHGANVCIKCAPRHKMVQVDDMSFCRPKCWCDFGVPELDSDGYCAEAKQQCAICATGYHMKPKKKECWPNRCICKGGRAAWGPNCPADGTPKCTGPSCLRGYHFESGVCKPNRCRCENGVGMVLGNCPVHGSAACGTCKEGVLVS